MKRLWVKLSIAFSGVIFLTFAVLFLFLFITSNNDIAEYAVEDVLYSFGYEIEELMKQAVIEGRESEFSAEIMERIKIKTDSVRENLIDKGYSYGVSPELIDDSIGEDLSYFIVSFVTPVLLVILAVSAFIGITSSIIISRSLTAPLRRLVKAATTIGDKNLNYRVSLKGTREFVELANAFNMMAEDLEKAEHQRRNMTADIAHELRTPLTVLEGTLRAFLDNVYDLTEERVAGLYSQTNHLIHLVKDLHELSRAETFKLPLDIAEINIMEIINETIRFFSCTAEEKNIGVRLISPAENVIIKGDRSRFRQIFTNLFNNAFAHTSNKGEISITVNPINDKVIISIDDDGDGIEPDQLRNVFNRFYREDRSRSRRTGGSGLGLAIVKALVEAHHGTITVQSEGKNKGSSFTLSLPV